MDLDASDVLAADDEGEETSPPPLSRQPAKPRTYPTPKIIDEVDVTSPTSLRDFVGSRSPKSDPEKFLMVAAWFKECRKQDDVNADEVYTCYRMMKWPYGIEEFGRPLRSLKAENLMKGTTRGRYAINQVGLVRVEAMGGE